MTPGASPGPVPASSPANLLQGWSWLLLDSLAAAGVRQVVLSPGSRSTPFVAAAAEHPALACRTLMDERVAAFYALGQARLTGRASLLVCTSGTAGAHYLPAVIEARQAGLPLVVLTADRPVSLAACGAPQTIDQVKLFGDHAQAFFDLGAPCASPDALAALQRTAAQAVLASRWPRPGAVHLNARVAKPLEPRPAVTEAEVALETQLRHLAAAPAARAEPPTAVPNGQAVAAVARALRGARRGLVVCGPAPKRFRLLAGALTRLARATGFPVLAEATSQLAGVDPALPGAEAALGDPAFRLVQAPEVVLSLGAPPASRALVRYLEEHPQARRFVVTEHAWTDPESRAEVLLFGDPGATLEALLEALPEEPEDADGEAWSEGWRRAAQLGLGAADHVLEEAGDALSEGGVARTLIDSLPDGARLMLGNSLPVRLVETWAGAGAWQSRRLTVLSQRGANGIDGLVAGAAGTTAAAAAEDLGGATALLLGDVSLLHDLGGLAAARDLDLPLVVVVLNNDGGRIFEQLPLLAEPRHRRNLAPGAEDHWLTPHGLGFGPAAALFGHRYARPADLVELHETLAEALETPGCTLVEAVVPPHGAAEARRRLGDHLQESLDALLASDDPTAEEG